MCPSTNRAFSNGTITSSACHRAQHMPGNEPLIWFRWVEPGKHETFRTPDTSALDLRDNWRGFIHLLKMAADHCYSPRNAEGETVPLLRETMTLIPVSMKGTEKSITSDLSSLMVRDPTAMWAFFNTTWAREKKRHPLLKQTLEMNPLLEQN